MTVYRITEFTSPDTAKAVEAMEPLRSDLASAGAESIEIVSVGDGKGLVVAKYATQAVMEAATSVQQKAFGTMIASGHINADSISGQFGEVVFTL
jgi:hypothetical protein